MIDALIPIGSVVRLEGQDWLAVILGFFPNDGNLVSDYLAAPYPTGLLSEDNVAFVNADAIAEVVSHGFLDEQGEEVLTVLADLKNAEEELYVTIGRKLAEQGLVPPEDADGDAGAQPFSMD